MIVGVVLSGGGSTRMGRPKALLPATRGAAAAEAPSFLQRICDNFAQAGIAPVIVVTGSHDAQIREHVAARHLRVHLVTNPEPARGQLSSLWCALDEMVRLRLGATAMAMTPVDHPWASVETVRRLVKAFRETGAPIVRPLSSEGTHGHPVILAATLFDRLRGADLDKGAKVVIHALADQIHHVSVDDPGAFADVDTPDDYERGLSTGIT